MFTLVQANDLLPSKVYVHDGCLWPPSAPGAGGEMVGGSLIDYSFPDGPMWAADTRKESR